MRSSVESGADVLILAAAALVLAVGVAFGQPDSASIVSEVDPAASEAEMFDGPHPITERDGLAYPVSDFRFEYALTHPDLPPLEEYERIEVPLVLTPEGYIGPIAGEPFVYVRLGDFNGARAATFYGSAIAAINRAIRDYLEDQYGLIGQLVTPSALEINFEGDRADLRSPAETWLTIQIWRATVGEVRTIGYGKRLRIDDEQGEDRINHPKHARVREGSPIGAGDLLNRELIDRRVYFLNRHPSRRVDVGIGPSGQAGEVVLDYMITEAKPWWIFAQASNTGTESTSDWVYRFGLIHNQLTNHDDILRLDYTTAGFDDSHSVFASYERPLGNERVRGKIYGGWNEYTASDVGLFGLSFMGEGYQFGGEAAWNVLQRGPFFLDLVGGVRYEHASVENQLALIEGESGFLLPYIGLRAERVTPVSTLFGQTMLEVNIPGVSDEPELVALGRTGVTEDFAVLRNQLSYSFFLEPILNRAGFEGRGDPDDMTLAHEMALSVRGQTTFGDRVVPNFQQTAGGFYTVRGYDESLAVGDDVVIATVEYRFHLGRAMPARQELGSFLGQPFRSARTQPYGSADWDVILRAFVDAAATRNNDRVLGERNETLIGAGLGVEGQLRNNLSARLDLGWALRDAGPVSNRTDAGDVRLHFVITVMF